MIIENKYVVVVNDLKECTIHEFFKTARIETSFNIIATSELNEIDINLLPILENIEDLEVNKIYNYKGKIICELGNN